LVLLARRSWVRKEQRRTGQGARLVEAAEAIARERGCERLNLFSFTYQAPDFYARHGYVEVARIEAMPVVGHADVHFVKHLRQVPFSHVP
jgi:GNAT superfamily N-acetyltransferase